MADITALQAAVSNLTSASQANAARVAQKLADLQAALAAAQTAGVSIPDDLVAAINAVTEALNAG